MATHLPRKIREFYDSDGEVPIWNGEPNAMPVSRITHPIIMFVTFVGIVLLLWACWVVVFEIIARSGATVGSDVIEHSGAQLFKSFAILLTGSLILGFSWYLRNFFKPAEQNQIYYLLSDQRAQIIKFNPLDPDKSERQYAGRGDMSKPSLQKVGDDRFNVIFFEAPGDFGKVEDEVNKVSKPRKTIVWQGFNDLTETDANDVYEKIKELLKNPVEIENDAYSFSFKVPERWTLNTFNIAPERRDDTVFNLLMGDVVDAHGLLKMPKILDEWNTAVLTKRLDSKLESERGAFPAITIVIEVNKRDGLPESTPEPFKMPDLIGINREINNRMYLQLGLIYQMFICQFRRGYRISQALLDNLTAWENSRKEKVVPEFVITNLNYFKDWETADKRVFDKIVEMAIPRQVSIGLRRELIKRIEQFAASNFPYINQPDGKILLQINPRSSDCEVHGSLESGKKLDSEIALGGKSFKMRQLYGYRSMGKGALHIRFTFFCPHGEKSKIFDDNVKTLESLANTIEWL